MVSSFQFLNSTKFTGLIWIFPHGDAAFSWLCSKCTSDPEPFNRCPPKKW